MKFDEFTWINQRQVYKSLQCHHRPRFTLRFRYIPSQLMNYLESYKFLNWSQYKYWDRIASSSISDHPVGSDIYLRIIFVDNGLRFRPYWVSQFNDSPFLRYWLQGDKFCVPVAFVYVHPGTIDIVKWSDHVGRTKKQKFNYCMRLNRQTNQNKYNLYW